MDSSFFKKNRETFYKTLPEGTLFVLCSGLPVHRTADDVRFFANRNFVYMTGIAEPDCMLISSRLHGEIHETIYIRDMNPAAEIRGGRRITAAEAAEKSGFCDIRFRSAFDADFHALARDIYFSSLFLCLESNTGQELTDQNHLFKNTASLKYPRLAIRDAYPQIARQRTFKSPEELEAICAAMKVTAEGISRMMSACKKAESESDLYAEFMYVIHKNRAVEPAFKPIISCGANNFYLHYDTPFANLQSGELCLVDVGAMVDFCCVDISRVFPRDGVFNPKQRLVYNISLEINDEITETIKPGMTFDYINELNRELTFERLKAEGLITDIADIGKYVWHGCTHHVGFDVHDAGSYNELIAENMFFTMDTGIYIREWGIGLRIEDNVLVTKNGLERISDDIPRTVADIEAVMAQ